MKHTALDTLNPVTRLLLCFVATTPLIVTLDWLSASVALASQVVVLRACGVSLRFMATRLLPVLVAAPIAAISMALYGRPGGRIWVDFGLLVVSDQSLMLALAVFIRIFALTLPVLVLLSGVDPTLMGDGLAQIVRLPAKLVLGSLAGVRMIGLFVSDWQTLARARRARGLGDQGRFKRWFTMAFAMLVFAIRRGSMLATAMEARGFGDATERTWARPSVLTWRDPVAFLVAISTVTLALGSAIWFGTIWYVWT